MKSVANSKRLPFHVNRKGQDEGLRSSSTIVDGARRVRLGLKNARGPEHADDIRARAAADAEHDVGWSSGRRCGGYLESIAQAARPQLDLRADRAAVADAGVEPHAYGPWSRATGGLRVAPEPEPSRLQVNDHVIVAVRIDVTHRHRDRILTRCEAAAGSADAVTSDHADPRDRHSRAPPGANASRSARPSLS